MPQCLVCNRTITGTHWLCHACYDIYGKFASWPEWLKGLKRIEQANRRYAQESGESEMTFLPLLEDDCEGMYLPTPELRTA